MKSKSNFVLFSIISVILAIFSCSESGNNTGLENHLPDDFSHAAYWDNNETVQNNCGKQDSLCIEEHWFEIGVLDSLSYLSTVENVSSAVSSSSTLVSSSSVSNRSSEVISSSSEASRSSEEVSSSSTEYSSIGELSSSVQFSSSSELSSSSSIVVRSVAKPTFNIPEGVYTSKQSVAISTTTNGSTIYYTTNGSTPTILSAVYSGPILISESQTLKAIAIKTDWDNSDVASVDYVITGQVATPSFNITAGTYTTTQNVSISTTTTGAIIYYTTDGITPTASSAVYSDPILISKSQTLKAIAVKTDWDNSDVASVDYVITGQVATPSFNISAGTYTTTQSVSISTTTTGAIIYYTTDGTTPTASSAVYNDPISVSASQIIKAIAIKPGWNNSTIESAQYIISTAINSQICTYNSTNNSLVCSEKTYRTTTIGSQVWMAENLNFDTGAGSYCYNDTSMYCNTYGRLYTWSIAMDGISSNSTNSSVIQGVCPTGWHLPSDGEWTTLSNYVIIKSSATNSNDVGSFFKATTSWNSSGNGTDDFGFSGISGGVRTTDGVYSRLGDATAWWSSTELNSSNAYSRHLDYSNDGFYRYLYDKSYANPVRCIQD